MATTTDQSVNSHSAFSPCTNAVFAALRSDSSRGTPLQRPEVGLAGLPPRVLPLSLSTHAPGVKTGLFPEQRARSRTGM